jgi:hypothetical protein
LISLDKLLLHTESEFLDFKQEYHDNNAKLIHDILCLVNSYTESDRYLVFGIEDDKTIHGIDTDPNRKNNANIQDLLRQSNFNRIPNTHLETVTHSSGKQIDILTIRNRPDKPFFLTKDKVEKGKTVRSGVIYTRLGDTNTPLGESASDDQIELMWRERFGLGLTPLERIRILLNDTHHWISVAEDKQLYHKQFPEFTIRQGKTIHNPFRETWTDSFSDVSAHSFEVELRYFGTILHTETFVMCDGGRYQLPLPELDTSTSPTTYYVKSDSFAYKIALIYNQYFPLTKALSMAKVAIH